MSSEDKIGTIDITDTGGGYSSDYYISDSDTISIGSIGAVGANAGVVTINPSMWTTTTTGTGGNTTWGIGNGGAGSVISTTNTGAGIGWVNPAANISLGDKFSIENPNDGSAPFIRYKDKKLPIDQLFSMVGAFKVMLIAVAKDEEFCNKHPEIRDLAYSYMLEELSK